MKLEFLKEAGKIHKSIRHELTEYLENNLTTAISYKEIAEFIETRVNQKTRDFKPPLSKMFNSQINRGLAFPVGLSSDYVVAHDTLVYPEDTRKFNKFNSILKIDFGVQIQGNIVDSAWSFTSSNHLKPFRDSTREAVREVIKLCRPDTYIRDIQDTANEVISSYEFKGERLQPIRNVCGHSISDYTIHAGKSFYAHSSFQPIEMRTHRLEADETWAIEFYSTNGNPCPIILNSPDVSKHNHFMISNYDKLKSNKNPEILEITRLIKKNIYTLPFSQMDIYNTNDYRNKPFDINKQLQILYNEQIATIFPTIYEPKRGVYCGQHEDTVFITEEKTINLTGDE